MVLEKMDFGSMKRKELQALCKKHNIPANLTNAEMAKRLKALSSVEEKAGILKRSIEKTNEDLPDVEDRLPKKVRFDLETQISEFEKSEVKHSEIKTRGRRKSLISMEIIVQSIHGVTKEIDGKKNVADDILKRKFHSSTDNAAPDNRGSNGDQMATRRSLRNKLTDDDKMGEMEDLVKGSNKTVTEIDEVEMKEKGSEYLNANPDKVSRRSKRNAVNTEGSKSLTATGSEIRVVEKGRPIIVDLEAKDDINMAAKEVISTGENLRKSKRHASRDEAPVTLDNIVGETNGGKEYSRKSAVNVNRNKKAAPEPAAEKPQKEKEIVKEIKRFKRPNAAAKNSAFEEVINNEQCSSQSDQLMIPKKECPPVAGKNTRRSKGTATKHELPIILENVVAATNDRQEARKQKKGYFNSVQEEDYTEVDHPSFIAGPVRRSARNTNINKEAAPEPMENGPQEKRGKTIKPRKEKNSRSKNPQLETYVPSLEAKDSFPELEAIEKPSLYVESTISKSESRDSVHEPLITLDKVDGDSDKGMEGANIQSIVSNDVQQEESAEMDQTLIHESVEAAPEPMENGPQEKRGKSIKPRKEKNSRSKNPRLETYVPSLEAKDSFPELEAIEKPSLYVESSISKSESHDSVHEPLITLDKVDGDSDKGMEGANIQSIVSNDVQQVESVETDQTLIHEFVEAAPEPMENGPQEKKGKSIKPRNEKNSRSKNTQLETYVPSLEAKDSFPELEAIEMPSLYVESTISKSESHDSVHEPLITLDNVDGDGDKGMGGANIQSIVSNDIQQEESSETDQTLIHESVGAALGLLKEIFFHEEKERLNDFLEMNDKSDAPVVVEASTLSQELTTEEHSIKDQPTLYVHLTPTGNADNIEYRNDDKTEVIFEDNIYNEKKLEKSSSIESYCRVENSTMEISTMNQTEHLEPMDIYPSDLVELKNDHTDSKSGTSPFDCKVGAAENASMPVESNRSKMVEHYLFAHSEILTDHFSNENVAEGISEEIGQHEEMKRSEELHKIMEKPDTPSKIDANSFTEDLMNEENSIKDEPTLYVQLNATENAGSLAYYKNEAFIEDNMHKEEMPESILSLNSYCRIENSPTEQRKHFQSMELYPSESMESLNGKSQVGETSEIFNEIDNCNVANQSDDINGPEDRKTWQMLFPGEQISSLTPHLDNVIQDNMISATEKKGSLEQNGIESTLANVSEKDPSSGLKKPSFTEDTCESEPLNCDDMNKVVYGAGHFALEPESDDNEEANNAINCVSTSSKSANLISKKRDAFDDEKVYEIHRNIDQEITWGEVERIEEDCCVGDQYNSSERFHESNVTVASVNIPLTLPMYKNVNDGHYSPKPADLVGLSHESKCIGFESGYFSSTGNQVSLRDNFKLESLDIKEYSGTIAEDEDYYGMQEQNQEMCGEFNKVGLNNDDDIVNGEKMDDSVNGGEGDDTVNGGKRDDTVNGENVDDIVNGAEPYMVPLASQVLAASTIGDWCADTEGHVSYDTNTKVEKDSHESIAIGFVEKHTDEPSDDCFLVVALPASVLPPEENTGTPEVYLSDSVDSCIKDNGTCKQGKELSSLFATPVAISSAMKETQLYNQEGQISNDIISPVERTSARKDEKGEAGGHDTSMVDITHDALEERSRQLDIQDLLDSQSSCFKHRYRSDPADHSVSDHAFSLSPGFETACVDVLTNDTEMTSQETDVGLHANRKYEEMNENELDQEKDQIHSAENNAELGIQNISDPQLTIRHGFMGLKDNNIAETSDFSDILTPVGSSLHRTTLEDTKSKVSVESREENIEGTNDDAFGKCSESVEQETLTEKDGIHSADKIDYLVGSVDKNHLLGLEDNDVSVIKTFVNGQSQSTVTAHDTLQCDSLSFLETEDGVEKSDDVPAAVAGREYTTSVVGHDDEGDSAVQVSAEVDVRIVDSHSPICELSAGWKETDNDNMKVETAHDEAMQTGSSVKGTKMIAMLEAELKKVQATEDNNGVGMEYNVLVEQEDNEEDDRIHITEINATLDTQDLVEMEESSHTIDTYFDLGSAHAETMAWLESGKEPVQVTDGYPAANTKYTASIEHEEHEEDNDEICSQGKSSDLSFVELEHESSNTEDLKECYVADTVAMSSDLNSAVKSSPGIDDAGDTILEDLLPEATINQVAFVDTVSVQVEKTDIASGANDISAASQELVELTETEHDKGAEIHTESIFEDKQAFEEGPTDMTVVVTEANQITKTIIHEVDGKDIGFVEGNKPQEADCCNISAAKVESMSVVRKNVRSILIHGTPNKMQARNDMKENMVNSKLDNNVGNLTSVRPASKRPALKDLRNE